MLHSDFRCGWCWLMLAIVSPWMVSDANAETIVPNSSVWKWWHSVEGKDPAEKDEDFYSSFYLAEFDDASWQQGADKTGPHGGFAYGEEEFTGIDIGTPTAEEDRKPAYFRLKFKTDKPFEQVVLKCQRDDGIIVYLDGQEVLRDNIAKDAKQGHAVFATATVSEEAETQISTFPLKVTLPAGEHILAISLHNRAGASSDLRIAEISLETPAQVAVPATTPQAE